MKLLVKNGHVVDPSNSIDKVCDILINEGVIEKIEVGILESNSEEIDASGKYVFPGLIDLHTHLREPGFEAKETIESGLNAAAAGGFTRVSSMPNTKPIIDNSALVRSLYERARGARAKLGVIGAATIGLETANLSEIGGMKEAGAIAISNDGRPVPTPYVTRRVLEYAKQFNMRLIEHCEDISLTNGGFMHEGYQSTILGMRGIPRESEDLIVARDIMLAEMTGGMIHIAHISSKNSVRMVREAKKRGVDVTAEVTPHHLLLTDKAVEGFDTDTKIAPPLREEEDRQALIEGLIDGTIDIIATDHAPHERWTKEVEYAYAPFGAVGLECALSLIYYKLVLNNIISIKDLVRFMANRPGEIFGLEGSLKIGAPGDIVIFDPNISWIIDPNKFFSKGKNTPFKNWDLKGKVDTTILDGRVVYKNGELL